MSAIEVGYDDIQVGDRIRMTREITVAKLFQNKDFIRSGDGLDSRTYFARGAKLERLPKPLNLPTKVGSVVRVFGHGWANSANWMLNSAGFWNSDRGGTKEKGGEFEEFILGNGFDVEVLA
ncbi:hypothetical protein SEA_HORTUS1_11 [Microbacterium phage Hortus1]|nr:hypothetical protein SEA_HORTUS1_11 [Microbacterium phage Hortus1]AWY05585.1 hypothetical protein SEA_OLINDD_11 [Microbacterium phage OlinDD]AWY06344.1 hypothetical protein SEA_TANDEM_11 [Microbacterium phage Tandem]